MSGLLLGDTVFVRPEYNSLSVFRNLQDAQAHRTFEMYGEHDTETLHTAGQIFTIVLQRKSKGLYLLRSQNKRYVWMYAEGLIRAYVQDSL